MTVSATLRAPPKLRYRTTERVAVVDPEDVSLDLTDPARLLSETNGAAGTLYLYDVAKSTGLRMRADASAAETLIQVNAGGVLEAGDVLEIETDSPGTVSENAIDSIDPDTGVITLSTGLVDDISRGRRVRVRIGSDVLAGFGTPAQGDDSWGLEAFVPANLDVEPGDFVRLEVWFSGAAGGTIDRRFWLVAEVVEEEL